MLWAIDIGIGMQGKHGKGEITDVSMSVSRLQAGLVEETSLKGSQGTYVPLHSGEPAPVTLMMTPFDFRFKRRGYSPSALGISTKISGTSSCRIPLSSNERGSIGRRVGMEGGNGGWQ